MSERLLHGSCDCGKVAFEVRFDLSKGTFKCNCRICWKLRFWCVLTTPDQFALLSGKDDLASYGVHRIHRFCRHCHVKLFSGPKDGSRIAVSVAALDNLAPEELAAAKVNFVDGLHDRWTESPAFTAHL